MKLRFTCISKNPPFALNADWQIDLELIEQQGIKLKELIQIDASPSAAEIFEIGAEYEMTLTKVDQVSDDKIKPTNQENVCSLCGGDGYIITSHRDTPDGWEMFGTFREDCPACSV
jgi:hypothetical protein